MSPRLKLASAPEVRVLTRSYQHALVQGDETKARDLRRRLHTAAAREAGWEAAVDWIEEARATAAPLEDPRAPRTAGTPLADLLVGLVLASAVVGLFLYAFLAVQP